MKLSRWCFAALFVVSVSWSHGEEPARTIPVEQLIERLADGDFHVRDKAAKAIEALGVEALQALRKARQHPDPEVRRRVEQWLPALERALVLAPKRVTLNLKHRPIREAFDGLAKQTGYKIELAQDAEREKQVYSFQLDQVPFWDAVDKLCDAAGVVLQHAYGSDGMQLHFQDRYVPFVHRQGAFRLVAQGFDYGRSVQFGSLPKTPTLTEQPTSEYLRLTFQIDAEPKLPLLGVGDVRLLEASDENGQSLLPPQSGNSEQARVRRAAHWYGGYRSHGLSTQVQLGSPVKPAKSVKLLRGTVPVTLLADEKTSLVSKDILKGKGKRATIGATTIDILDVTQTPNKQYEIKMSVSEPKKDGADYYWVNSLYHRLELQDDKGHKYVIYGSSTSLNGNSAQVSFTYAPRGNAGPPSQLVYHEWVTMQHEIAFTFKDLPLP